MLVLYTRAHYRPTLKDYIIGLGARIVEERKDLVLPLYPVTRSPGPIASHHYPADSPLLKNIFRLSFAAERGYN